MSIANLESIIESAARIALKAASSITPAHLDEALEVIRFGETRPRSRDEVMRTARHEAGHTIMYWLSGWWPTYVTVVSRGDHGGYMAHSAEEIENRGIRTKEQLLASIRVCLGGRAAELIYYGEDEGLSTGPSSDLLNATNQARDIICRYGMDQDFGLIVTSELMKYEGGLSSPIHQQINKGISSILSEQMKLTQQLLTENRKYLDAVSDALADTERLAKEELQDILQERRTN